MLPAAEQYQQFFTCVLRRAQRCWVRRYRCPARNSRHGRAVPLSASQPHSAPAPMEQQQHHGRALTKQRLQTPPIITCGAIHSKHTVPVGSHSPHRGGLRVCHTMWWAGAGVRGRAVDQSQRDAVIEPRHPHSCTTRRPEQAPTRGVEQSRRRPEQAVDQSRRRHSPRAAFAVEAGRVPLQALHAG